ncbi:MAG: outer membrane lipoprotein-sorting protein [bacterium]|nr:outer membrane lipoprotein-sorting protein [bacterium]
MPKRAAVAPCLLALALAAPPSRAVDGREILRKMDDLWRGNSSAAIFSMQIKTEHWQRSLEMKAYSKGKDLSLVRIVRPKQEAGTATLKVDENIWNYLPKTRRVMKIPSSMMMGSWMGSHFTNDDLVRESRLEEDYTFELAEELSADGTAVYLVTLNPRPEAPVVWGKIVLEVAQETLMPNWQEYYDEEGKLVRRAVFEDVRTIGERRLPMVMRMVPVDKPDEFTEIIYEKLIFDVPIEDDFFSIQNLKRR